MITKPLDIFICAGRGKLPALIRATNRITGKRKVTWPLTHVAGGLSGDRIEEATTDNKWCDKQGYQINDAGLWLKNYSGSVYRRKFTGYLPDHYDQIEQDFYEDNKGTPYESGIPGVVELIQAGLGIHPLPATNDLHCPEVLMKKVKACNFLAGFLRDHLFAPADFWHQGYFDYLISTANNGAIMWEPAELIKE